MGRTGLILAALGVTLAGAAVVSYMSTEDEENALMSRCEKAIIHCEKQLAQAGKEGNSEDDYKLLSLDVDFIFEKLDTVASDPSTKIRDPKKKERRKALVQRVSKLAAILDAQKAQ